jgi:hypothetical protein
VLIPTTLTFAPETVGQTSTPQTITLSNGSRKALTITLWHIGPDFKIVSNTCGKRPATLPVGQSCSFEVSFQPKSPGNKHELFQVYDSANRSPQVVHLRGTATSP